MYEKYTSQYELIDPNSNSHPGSFASHNTRCGVYSPHRSTLTRGVYSTMIQENNDMQTRQEESASSKNN